MFIFIAETNFQKMNNNPRSEFVQLHLILDLVKLVDVYLGSEPLIRLAIIGCREYTNYQEFKSQVDQYIYEADGKVIEIISGKQNGTEYMAQTYAREKMIPLTKIRPNTNKWGYNARLMNDRGIAAACTHLLVFGSAVWLVERKGCISDVKLLNKPCTFIHIQTNSG